MKLIIVLNFILNVKIVYSIIGGYEVVPNEFPWVLRLETQSGLNTIYRSYF